MYVWPEWDVSRVGCVVPLRFTPSSTRLSSLTLDPREKRVDEPVCVCVTRRFALLPLGLCVHQKRAFFCSSAGFEVETF